MAIKVMLVEDEAGIRHILRKIIEKHTEFEVAAECDEMGQAIVDFRLHKPDVVFLDIGIKGQNGVECARILTDLDPKVKIIFATAHSEYMSEAFEIYAFDYLMKPFSIERVNKTLDRIAALEIPAGFESGEKIVKTEKRRDKLLVKGKESLSFVDIPDIILILRENNSTAIYTEKGSFATSASLAEIEQKRDPEQFLRSHKSYIINLSKIRKIEPYGRWTYTVHFQTGKETALITAEKYEEIKKRFL